MRIHLMPVAVGVSLGTLAIGSAVRAEVSELSLLPTETSIGVSVRFDSPSTNDHAQIWFKRSDETEWREGIRMRRPPTPGALHVQDTRWVGSVFHLTPGESYDVRVDAYDGSSALTGSVEGTVSTWIGSWLPGGNVISVSPPASPADTPIADALASAVAGDTLSIEPGTYYEMLEIQQSGAEGAPISLVNANPAAGPVILDGTDGTVSYAWQLEDVDRQIYSTPLSYLPVTVVADDARLFAHASLASLQEGIRWAEDFWSTESIVDGYYFDEASSRLLVRLPGSWANRDPAAHEMHISRTSDHFATLLGIWGDWIHVDGLEFRYLPMGVRLEGDHLHVTNCTFRYMQKAGVYSKDGTSQSIVENNLFYDNGLYDWPWFAMKNYEMQAIDGPSNETNGIQIGGAELGKSSSIFRHNTIDGVANGICIGLPNVDVHDNQLIHIADDAFEPDTVDSMTENQRYYANRIDQVFQALSLAPLNGLVYFAHNVVTGYRAYAIKHDADNSSYGPVEFWNNTFFSTYDRGDFGPNYVFKVAAEVWHHTFANNIAYARDWGIQDITDGSMSTADSSFDFDLWYTMGPDFWTFNGETYTDLADVRARIPGWEQNGIEPAEDPASTFVDAAGADMRLGAGSPAIDQGLLIVGFHCPRSNAEDPNQQYCVKWEGTASTVGAQTKGPDMGAYELGAAAGWGGSGATGAAGGAGASGGAGAAAGTAPGTEPSPAEDDSGCGCVLPGASPSRAPVAWGALGLLLALGARGRGAKAALRLKPRSSRT